MRRNKREANGKEENRVEDLVGKITLVVDQFVWDMDFSANQLSNNLIPEVGRSLQAQPTKKQAQEKPKPPVRQQQVLVMNPSSDVYDVISVPIIKEHQD